MEEKTAKSLLDFFNNPNKKESEFIGAKGNDKKREMSDDSDDNDEGITNQELEIYNDDYKKKKKNNDYFDEINLKDIPINIKKNIIKYIGNDILKKIVNSDFSRSYWSREAQIQYTDTTKTYLENLFNSIVFDMMDLFVYLKMYSENKERNPENKIIVKSMYHFKISKEEDKIHEIFDKYFDLSFIRNIKISNIDSRGVDGYLTMKYLFKHKKKFNMIIVDDLDGKDIRKEKLDFEKLIPNTYFWDILITNLEYINEIKLSECIIPPELFTLKTLKKLTLNDCVIVLREDLKVISPLKELYVNNLNFYSVISTDRSEQWTSLLSYGFFKCFKTLKKIYYNDKSNNELKIYSNTIEYIETGFEEIDDNYDYEESSLIYDNILNCKILKVLDLKYTIIDIDILNNIENIEVLKLDHCFLYYHDPIKEAYNLNIKYYSNIYNLFTEIEVNYGNKFVQYPPILTDYYYALNIYDSVRSSVYYIDLINFKMIQYFYTKMKKMKYFYSRASYISFIPDFSVMEYWKELEVIDIMLTLPIIFKDDNDFMLKFPYDPKIQNHPLTKQRFIEYFNQFKYLDLKRSKIIYGQYDYLDLVRENRKYSLSRYNFDPNLNFKFEKKMIENKIAYYPQLNNPPYDYSEITKQLKGHIDKHAKYTQ